LRENTWEGQERDKHVIGNSACNYSALHKTVLMKIYCATGALIRPLPVLGEVVNRGDLDRISARRISHRQDPEPCVRNRDAPADGSRAGQSKTNPNRGEFHLLRL